MLVAPDLRVPGRDNVFVAGDLMHLENDGKTVPGVAPAAIQAGRCAARNIAALVAGKPTRAFRYRDKGSLATIGRAKAVGQMGKTEFSGWFAWWVWWVVHIAYLVGFRNRIAVMMGWAWQYFAFSRGARLITGRWWAGAAEHSLREGGPRAAPDATAPDATGPDATGPDTTGPASTPGSGQERGPAGRSSGDDGAVEVEEGSSRRCEEASLLP